MTSTVLNYINWAVLSIISSRMCFSTIMMIILSSWSRVCFVLTSVSLSFCSRDAAISSFFSSKARPSSAASIRSASIPPPLSTLPGEDEDEGRAKERETAEDEERGKKESSMLGEGRLFFRGVNMTDTGACWNQLGSIHPGSWTCNLHSNRKSSDAEWFSAYPRFSSQRCQRSWCSGNSALLFLTDESEGKGYVTMRLVVFWWYNLTKPVKRPFVWQVLWLLWPKYQLGYSHCSSPFPEFHRLFTS